ncbi:50S ribosomal protein L25 [Candidatus Saganbacteria bacterium]|nr:50S ribosomal protein L25 [Candidatus Saganbacteria bacterium]
MTKEQVEIKAAERQALGKKAKKLKASGQIPAVVYGRKFPATAIAIDLKEFTKKVLQSDAGHNLIFNLNVAAGEKSKNVPVITQQVQRNPLNGEIIHLDLRHIVMDEAIKTSVPVELIGTPIGVKDSGGVLVHGLREIEIKCLPGNIPDKFEIDVAQLAINTSLHVSDLKAAQEIEVLSDPAEMIANVSPPTKEEEAAAQPTFAAEGAPAEGTAAEAAASAAAGKPGEKAAPATAGKPAAETKSAAAGATAGKASEPKKK